MPELDLSRLDSLLDDEEEQLPVLHLTPVWSEYIHLDERDEDLCFIGWHEGQLVGWLKIASPFASRPEPHLPPIAFPVHVAPARLNHDGSVNTFQIRKIGPSTWVLNPSLNMPLVHAFVVFCEVPEPPPWEREG